MKKILFTVLVASMVVSCCTADKSVLNITASSFPDSTQVLVNKLNINQLQTIDTLYIKGGKAVCELSDVPSTPNFYYVEVPGKNRVSLILSSGQNADVNLDKWSVEGSEESVLFNAIEQEYAEFFKQISDKTRKLAEIDDARERKQMQTEIAKHYIAFKKQSIKRVMTSPASMTNIPVLFRKVFDVQIFGDDNDAYLMQNVYDTLSVLYPQSPYVVSLGNEIELKRQRKELDNMISGAPVIPFPEISLPDINGKQRLLSEVKEKVILLLFWNSELANIPVMNAELKNLYSKFHDKSFEIYQVALEANKTLWASSVRNQDIKWISVIDTRASQSACIPLYYVSNLPFAYVMNQNGDMLYKGDVDMERIETVISKAVK
ncbi:MAG: redoxin domain-containing protein [Alistipes sp.]|nr:redoxin domain-containing protein [Candidatus Minthomonas equi]